MKRTALLACALVAVFLAAGTSATRADECDDTVTAIKKRMDEVRAERKDGEQRPKICARLGRLSGMSQAIRIIASECMDEGVERDAVIKDAEATEGLLDVDLVCN